ncbi:MAG: DUF2079 domain-containing protein [Acidimicrobiia bacterium]|nr:DUF2079 domain-containing protein [Acidimicrobiia bacterium]
MARARLSVTLGAVPAHPAQQDWRSRLERATLRWQARLDTAVVDSVLPWIMALAGGAVLAGLALTRAHSLQAGTELALFNQSIWQVSEGFRPQSTLVGGDYLARNGAFIIYPLSVLVRWLPITTTVLVVQASALALGIVPLWRIARRRADLKVAPAAAVALAYAAYAALHNANLSGFHPETLAVPALLGAVYYGLGARWTPFGVLVAVVLACRSELGWMVLVLGVVLATELRPRATGTEDLERQHSLWRVPARVGRSLLAISGRHSRTALIWAFVGLLWSLLATETIQPLLAGGEFPHLARYAEYGDSSTADVIWGILRQPHVFLGNLVTQENFVLMVTLLAPVLFLPLVELRYLMPAVPFFVVQLASDAPQALLAETVPVAVFVLVATTFALRRAGAMLVRRVRVNRRLVVTLLLASVIFFVRDAASSPFHTPWQWTRDAADADRLAATEQIPDDAAVRASPQLLPLLAERNVLFELETAGSTARAAAQSAVEGVGWIALDLASAGQWGSDSLEVERFDTTLRQRGWERVFAAEQVRVYRYAGSGAVSAAPGT